MLAVALGALVWGPIADRFGRRLVLWSASAAFVASSVVCVFAKSIEVLVAFRALQGVALAAYAVGTNAVRGGVTPGPATGGV